MHKHFGAQVVLRGISLEIEERMTTAIVGPSGTGKSVLLKIITGLLPADGGEVLIRGESMTSARNGNERRRICEQMGVLFQAAALFDSMTVYENVAFPLRQRSKHSDREIYKAVMQRLEQVGLEGFEGAYPGEVSIGMRKRVGVARALVTNPTILLFDEPNTGLDPEMGQDLYELIRHVQEISGFTGIVISHEIPEVFQICDRVAMLYDGVVQYAGEVDGFFQSENEIVKQFVRGDVAGPISMN